MILPLWFKVLMVIFLFFLGASVYSFLNVVIFRVPRGEEFVKTRSHCPGCGKLLTPLELVPVVSYVCLGGKCKKCGSRIGIRDVLIEVFGGLSAIASFWIFCQKPVDSLAQVAFGDFYARFLAGLTAFAFIGALTVITYIQNDMGVVKAGTLIALGIIALVGIFTMPEFEIMDRVIGAFSLSIVVAILALIFKNAVPMGLTGMMAIGGFFLGWSKLLFVAAPVTLAVAILEWLLLVILGKKPLGKHYRIVFALSVGLLVAILFGDLILAACGLA